MQHASIWQRRVHLPDFPPLQGDRSVHTVIIGGGLTGLTTARLLREKGVKALVLDAGRIGSGQTGRTTAKVTSQHGLIYAKLVRTLGEQAAGQYARANQEAVSDWARLIRRDRIACRFTSRESFLYACAETSSLEQEAEAACRLGLPAAFTRDTELPFPISGAVRFGQQASFHPLLLLAALAEGTEICGHTPVLHAERDRVHTPGGVVRAEHIVFACHYPFVNLPGWHFLRMHQERSHVLALKSAWTPRGMYLGIDGDALSFREAEDLLLLGGVAHRTGENEAGGCFDLLRDRARTLFPGAQEVAAWAAQDCMTADGVPFIGQYARNRPTWHLATGFGKWGMTSAMAAARVITGRICGDVPEWAAVFAPQRFHFRAEKKSLADEAAHAVKNLATFSTPRCPHMGCALSWNPDEHTWDCPCHGSRFTEDGAPLDGPAQVGMGRRRCREAGRRGAGSEGMTRNK